MKNYISHHPWKIVENGFHVEENEVTESLMSLGNGRMGQRGNFEETYSGATLQGNYIAGVWFPDKTKVGWWKNGYPDYFAKVINATNWAGLRVFVDDLEFDLAKVKILDFKRELDMQKGILWRSCQVEMPNGKQIQVVSERFCSMAKDELGVLRYSVKALNFSGKIGLEILLDADVQNKDANHGEKFWEQMSATQAGSYNELQIQTKKSPWASVPQFQVCSAIDFKVFLDGDQLDATIEHSQKDKFLSAHLAVSVGEGQELVLEKYGLNLSSENHKLSSFSDVAKSYLAEAHSHGYEALKAAHVEVWKDKWARNDIKIEGDIAAQQGIRFNIFHLQQTYTGQDARLNIGPKGFTGEKYGGVTYWDTEAYCLPFYLSAADASVAKNLLVYRHNHLQKAIENAQKLGFNKGAALYPMVTMNGEECHNEWEITFEEIHRNGAIAYAIFDYINYTGDQNYLKSHGLEVLVGISRFWKQRITYSENLEKFVMLGVTGPNEYENNVNNNFYTNYQAVWVLKYTIEALEFVKTDEAIYKEIVNKLNFNEAEEVADWQKIIGNMYFPYDAERQIYLQQDGFLDKELMPASQITEHRPINQKWSWDRILRSCFIKQADVLQGFYFFEDDFSEDELRRNFDFYEPMTVHESSLSPCVHSILACKLGKIDKAYEMYVRTARLDIDDYNNDTEDGLHITSMAGTWMSLVKGFGGFRVKNQKVFLDPILPKNWDSVSFRVGVSGALIEVTIEKEVLKIENFSSQNLEVVVYGENQSLAANSKSTFKRP
jgi:maltose phosphorylase